MNEVKIGETIELDGRLFKAVQTNRSCDNCALLASYPEDCPYIRMCWDGYRSDRIDIRFVEVN